MTRKTRETRLTRTFALALTMLFGCMSMSFAEEAPAGLKIAFIGDQGASGEKKAAEVLQLIKDEGEDVVVHPGALDYPPDPEAWDALVNDVYLVAGAVHFLKLELHRGSVSVGFLSDGLLKSASVVYIRNTPIE